MFTRVKLNERCEKKLCFMNASHFFLITLPHVCYKCIQNSSVYTQRTRDKNWDIVTVRVHMVQCKRQAKNIILINFRFKKHKKKCILFIIILKNTIFFVIFDFGLLSNIFSRLFTPYYLLYCIIRAYLSSQIFDFPLCTLKIWKISIRKIYFEKKEQS